MFLATLTLVAPLAAVPVSDPLPMPPPPPGMTLRAPEEVLDDELPMPPPPPGMKELTEEELRALLGEQYGEIESEAAELEALRALEEATLDPAAHADLILRRSLQHFGPGHPLRQRLEDVLRQRDHRDEAPPELAPVTDLLAFDVSQVADRYDIPVEMQPLVAQYIRFFQGPGRKWFRRWVSRSTRYIPVMQPILEAYGVPRDTVYVAMIESGFSSQAYSWAHAAGPWQFIPGTATWFGLKQDFWVDERRDPIKATHAAAKYLRLLYSELGHWYLAWAGYNTGGARVRRLCERKGTTDFWELSEGRGLMPETRHYVPKVIAAALIAKNPQAFGFSHDEFDYQAPLEFDEVRIVDVTDLSVIAKAAGVSEDEIRELNPELKRGCTPPATEEAPYVLRIPKGRLAQFTENFSKVPKAQRMRYVEHRVKPGDTLSRIARRHGTSAEVIMTFNGIRNARALKVNTALMIPVLDGEVPKRTTAGRKADSAKRGGGGSRAPARAGR